MKQTGASRISFSFFNDNDKSVVENSNQQLYDNISEDVIKSDISVRQSDENRIRESSPIINDGGRANADAKSHGESEDTSVPVELSRSISENCDSWPSTQPNGCSKERHVTKLTILLSSVRPASIEAEGTSPLWQPPSYSPVKNDHERLPSPKNESLSASSQHEDESLQLSCPAVGAGNTDLPKDADATAAEETNALYSVIEKCSHPNPCDSFVDNLDVEVDYAELGEFQQTMPSPDQAEVPNMEYCNHRARVKTRLRKISLRRKRKPQPSLKKMNVRLNRAWRSLRGWWHEEKSKLSHFAAKSASREEETVDSVASGSRAGSCSAPSDKSFYEALKKDEGESLPREDDDDEQAADGGVDEDGYCSLEPRRRRFSSVDGARMADELTLRRKSCISELSAMRTYPPHPPPRTAGVNAFRKSKYYPPQVSTRLGNTCL